DDMIMLVWFLDDGCVIRNKSGALDMKLSSEGFSKQDNLILCNLLNARYNANFKLYECKWGKFHIRGYGNSAQAVIDDITPIYPFDIMGRKATWLKPFTKKIRSSDIKRAKIK